MFVIEPDTVIILINPDRCQAFAVTDGADRCSAQRVIGDAMHRTAQVLAAVIEDGVFFAVQSARHVYTQVTIRQQLLLKYEHDNG